MPVRHALVRLQEGGLVTIERNRGAVVSKLSMDELNDFYNLRRLLEPASIQLGVERMTPERITRIQSIMTALDAAVSESDLVTVLNLDEDLLLMIHEAIANQQLTRVIKETWARVRPYKLLFTTTAQVDAGPYIAREDASLVQATIDGDGPKARDIVDQSLTNAQIRLADLLRSHTVAALDSSAANREPLDAIIARLVDSDAGEASELAGI